MDRFFANKECGMKEEGVDKDKKTVISDSSECSDCSECSEDLESSLENSSSSNSDCSSPS